MITDDIIIYTDGGCDPNPGPGGWGVLILVDGGQRELWGGETESTNNRMELTAAIQGLKEIKFPSRVKMFSDSQYVVKGIKEWMPRWLAKNWRGANGPVANQDLWKELLEVSRIHQVTWEWQRGHSGNIYNERVDYLCHHARQSLKTRPAM